MTDETAVDDVDYKPLARQLREPLPIDELSTQQAHLRLLDVLIVTSPTQEAKLAFQELSNQRRQDLLANMHDKYGVDRYFRGQGPSMTKFVNGVALLGWMIDSPQAEIWSRQKAEALLQKFNLRETMGFNQHAYPALVQLLTKISQQLFGEVFGIHVPFFPLIDYPMVNPEAVESDFMISPSLPGQLKQQTLILITRFDPDCVAMVIFRAPTKQITIQFYHPFEMVWVAHGGQYMYPGFIEDVNREWLKMEKRLHLRKGKLDLPTTMAQLQVKVNKIFDHESILPQCVGCYLRASAFESRICIAWQQYELFFINTGGAYPSRSFFLSTKGGTTATMTLPLGDLSDLERGGLVAKAEEELDRIINEFISEPEEIPQLKATIPSGMVPSTLGAGGIIHTILSTNNK